MDKIRNSSDFVRFTIIIATIEVVIIIMILIFAISSACFAYQAK